MKKKGSNKARVAVARKLVIQMYETYLTKQPYIEPPPKPKHKQESLKFHTEELLKLVELSKKNDGCIHVKNANQLKPLAMACEAISK